MTRRMTMKWQTVRGMPNITRALCIVAAMVFASAIVAQDKVRADHTVVSVLRMAKDLTETVSARGPQRTLRFEVARSIQQTRQEAAFGSYVADAYKQMTQGALPNSVRENPHWIKNQELEEEARRAFLSGDPERAKQLLLQCYEIPHWRPCLTIDFFMQARFLHWELDAGHLSAALDRFKANDWKSLKHALMLKVVRTHIMAGRQADTADLMSQLDDSFREAEQLGRLGAGAALRKLAMTGNVNAAMEGALSQPGISERVIGLLIIAESLAGLPGLPEETLQRF